MLRNSLIVAAVSGVFASTTMAGFTLTVTAGAQTAGLIPYSVVAVNDQLTTGTQIKGLQYNYSGAPAVFSGTDTEVDGNGDPAPNGTIDTVDLLSATRTRVRVSSTAANNTFVGVSPTNGYAEPNPYFPGASSFSGSIANTGTTQATGAGFQIARIFLPVGGTGVFSGNLGGDIGSKVPFSVNIGASNAAPVINGGAPIPDTNVVFGSIVSGGAPFSVTVNVTDANALDILALAAGPAPVGITGLTVTGATGVSPRSFIVSGTVDYSLNGTTVIIPITATDGAGGSSTGNFRLIVTPEPASLSLIGLGGLLISRRRK